MSTDVDSQSLHANKTITTVIYALYAASLLSGVTSLVAIVMNYIKRDDVAGTYLDSHFRWQIRTFWFTCLWVALGVITLPIIIGFGVLAFAGVWFIYRIAKGWIQLTEERPMYGG